ncbi:MAG: hypothetical protein IMZ75_16455 [Actinobacteria bacterium]|nr:hypothetical protein [Actinomycetota bacterium]
MRHTADQKLLRSTGAGNLFMVFGEPDLELRTLPGGKLHAQSSAGMEEFSYERLADAART